MAAILPFIVAAATIATTVKSFTSGSGGSGGSGGEQQAQSSSAEEIVAQKKAKDLIDAKTLRETSERAARGRIITARAAGPQTLFTKPGSIPLPRKLGGGLRS